MSLEEDLAIIRLKEKVLAEASQPGVQSNTAFRLRMVESIRSMEQESSKERASRRWQRHGRVDKVDPPRETDEYFQELHKATEPDDFWRLPEATYNVLEHKTRPPPPKQADLWY